MTRPRDELLEAVLEAEEAQPGSKEARRLEDAVSHLARRMLDCSPVHIRVPVAAYHEESSLTHGGRTRRGYAPYIQRSMQVEAPSIHITDWLSQEEWRRARGGIAVLPLPPTPWSLDYAYMQAVSAGARGVVFHTDNPPRWHVGYYPYTRTPPQTPIPAVIVHEGDEPPEGRPTRLRVDAYMEHSTARIILCRGRSAGRLIITHHDYQPPYRDQVLSAIEAGLELAAETGAGFASLPSETTAPPHKRLWWGYSIRLLLDSLEAMPGEVLYIDRVGSNLRVHDCAVHTASALHEICRRGVPGASITAEWRDYSASAEPASHVSRAMKGIHGQHPPQWYYYAPLPLRRSLYRLMRLGVIFSPTLSLKEYTASPPVIDSEPASAVLAATMIGRVKGLRVIVDLDACHTLLPASNAVKNLLRDEAVRESMILDAIYYRLLLAGLPQS